MNEAPQDIWITKARAGVYHAFSTFQKRFESKYSKATEYLVKDKTEMLAFYGYPSEH